MCRLEFACRLRYPQGFAIDATFTANAAVTALLGPSGSGKTSILSMIAGLRQPDSGRICVDDQVLFDSKTHTNLPPESRRIGYVFQEDLLFPHLTVEKNLRYGMRRRPAGPTRIDLDRVAQVLELADLLDRLPHTLSGGQRQRVALGRALLSNPQLLLLDEPLVGTDAPLKQRVLVYIERVLAEWQIPTIYVSHDVREAGRMASWVVIVERGEVLVSGARSDVLRAIGKEPAGGEG